MVSSLGLVRLGFATNALTTDQFASSHKNTNQTLLENDQV
jgi:hypothetical protein